MYTMYHLVGLAVILVVLLLIFLLMLMTFYFWPLRGLLCKI